jgi:ParB family chromosome partitioning protein
VSPASDGNPTPATADAAASSTSAGERVRRVALASIRPCPHQPRKDFSQESLQELAESIREQGIIQPLLVRPQGSHYELIAGERRWRAAQMLELAEVPVLIRNVDDREMLELALIENLQRDNLNALEEALGYSQLIHQFELRQEDVAQRVGKSRAQVANALRLLKLSEALQTSVREGKLSVGHAKVILGLPTQEEQALAAECVQRDGLNVRQTEELVAMFQNQHKARQETRTTTRPSPARDAHVADLESKLRERLGTKVQLHYRQGKGVLHIRFFSDGELDRILQTVGVQLD